MLRVTLTEVLCIVCNHDQLAMGIRLIHVGNNVSDPMTISQIIIRVFSVKNTTLGNMKNGEGRNLIVR